MFRDHREATDAVIPHSRHRIPPPKESMRPMAATHRVPFRILFKGGRPGDAGRSNPGAVAKELPPAFCGAERFGMTLPVLNAQPTNPQRNRREMAAVLREYRTESGPNPASAAG